MFKLDQCFIDKAMMLRYSFMWQHREMFSISFFLYLSQESNRGPGIVNVKVGSNCSSDVNGNHAGLFIRELKKKWTISFNWSQQSKLVQKKALIEKCAKLVKYIDERDRMMLDIIH